MASQFGTNLFSVVTVGAHQRNASLATAVTITVPNNATGMFIQAEGQAIRYTVNTPTVPTATLGFLMQVADQPVRLDLNPGAVVRVIENVVGGAVNYQFFRSV